jgi:uncharacterized protein
LFGVSGRPSSHLDPRDPFVIDTRELGRRAGSMQELHRDVPAPESWGLELVRIPAGGTISFDLRLESVMDGVLVTAEVAAPVEAECGRCLDPVSADVAADIQELFAYEPDPDDEDALVLDGDLIDLGPVIRDALVLSLPLNPLCDPDCQGLCSDCGARLDEVGSDHQHEQVDPRWAALAGLGQAGSEPTDADPVHTGNATTEVETIEEN